MRPEFHHQSLVGRSSAVGMGRRY